MTQEIRRKRNADKNKLEERGGRGGRGRARGRGGYLREETPSEPEKKRDNTFADLEKPEEKIFEQGVIDLNKFIEKINQFEKITNQSLLDIWRDNGPLFQPIKVKLDL